MMNQKQGEEREKILKVIEKYRTFFEEWEADVALGVKGKHFFYLFDSDYSDEFEVFNSFETGEELEQLILSVLSGNITCCLENIAESRDTRFSADAINGEYNNYYPDNGMQSMYRDVRWMAEQSAKWFGLMEKTYRALANISKEK